MKPIELTPEERHALAADDEDAARFHPGEFMFLSAVGMLCWHIGSFAESVTAGDMRGAWKHHLSAQVQAVEALERLETLERRALP